MLGFQRHILSKTVGFLSAAAIMLATPLFTAPSALADPTPPPDPTLTAGGTYVILDPVTMQPIDREAQPGDIVVITPTVTVDASGSVRQIQVELKRWDDALNDGQGGWISFEPYVWDSTLNAGKGDYVSTDPAYFTPPLSCSLPGGGGPDGSNVGNGKTVTCGTINYVLQPSDFANGALTLKLGLYATGMHPNTTGRFGNGIAFPIYIAFANLLLTKTVDPQVVSGPGAQVTYSFKLSYTGSMPLSGITVTDPILAAAGITITCPSTLAAPAAGDVTTVTCTASGPYTVTKADLENGPVVGQFTNVATASATATDAVNHTTKTVGAEDQATVSLAQLSIQKTITDPADSVVYQTGDVVHYQFVVKNTGWSRIDNVTVTDPMPGLSAIDCGTYDVYDDAGNVTGTAPYVLGSISLAAQSSITCTATYTVTGADMAAGSVTNTATAKGVYHPNDGENADVSAQDSATFSEWAPMGTLTMTKTADPQVITNPGSDSVTYTFSGVYTGNMGQPTIYIDDPEIGVSYLPCPVVSSDGDTYNYSCTAIYTPKASDFSDAHEFVNTAIATATATMTNPNDPSTVISMTQQKQDSATVYLAQLTVTKKVGDQTGTPGLGINAGFVITVTNSGAVPIDFIDINDIIKAGLPSEQALTVTCSPYKDGADLSNVSLDAGGTLNCTAIYVSVTLDDLDLCKITNTATATGYWRSLDATGPQDSDKVADPSHAVTATDSAVLTTLQEPGVSLTTSVFPTSVTAGDTVTFSYVITNTGNVTLTNFDFGSGPTITGTPGTVEAVGPLDCNGFDLVSGTLAPHGTATCTITVKTTAKDSTEQNPDSDSVSSSASVTAYPLATNVCSRDVHVSSDGQSNADVPVTPKFLPDPSMSISKVADTTVITGPTTVNYTITVTNTGNTDLTNIKVTDPDADSVTCPAYDIPYGVGNHITCTATHYFSIDELAGATSFVNTATVTADWQHDDQSGTVDPQQAQATVWLAQLSVTKTQTSANHDLGDTQTYNILVQNTGGTEIDFISLADVINAGAPDPANGQKLTDLSCPSGVDPLGFSLDAGKDVTCTVTYEITQPDLDVCQLSNTATATGYYRVPGSDAAKDPDHMLSGTGYVSEFTDQNYALTLTTDAAPDSVTAGGQVTFTYTITNTGNVSLTNFDLQTQVINNKDQGNLDCGQFDLATGVLAPTQSATCHLTITTDTAETTDQVPTPVNITSSATLTANPVSGNVCSSEKLPSVLSDQSVPVTPTFKAEPNMSISKVVDQPVITEVGTKVVYTITVSNTGNTDLSNIKVVDGDITDLLCSGDSILFHGPDVVCTGWHEVSAADLAHDGTFTNTASVTADSTHDGDPAGSVDPEQASATVSLAQLSVTKQLANPDATPGLNGSADFIVHVTNSGAVPIDFINIKDIIKPDTDKQSLSVSCDGFSDPTNVSLAAGQTASCTVTYPSVTLSDLDVCKITNTATATGSYRVPGSDAAENPDHAVTATDSAVLTTLQEPGVSLTTTVDKTPATAGDTLTFTYMITNTGNVSLHNFDLQPTISGAGMQGTPNCDVDLSTGVLAPKEQAICTVTFLTDPADSDAQVPTAAIVSSSATVTAAPLATNLCSTAEVSSGESATDVPVYPTFKAMPGISISKVVDKPVITEVGTTVHYTITVSNTGNTDLSNIKVEDGDITDLSCNGDSILFHGPDIVCTGWHEVSAADLAHDGTFTNTASVTADSTHDGEPAGSVDPEQASATVSLAQLSVTKQLANPDATPGLNGSADFIVHVANTGAVTLDFININDVIKAATADQTLSVKSCTGVMNPADITLAAGASTDCTVTYASVTLSDLDVCKITNTATGTGYYRSPSATSSSDADKVDGHEVQDSGDAVLTTLQDAKFSLTQSVDPASVIADGTNAVTFTYRVENTGNVTLTNIAVTPSFTGSNGTPGDINCDKTTLAPGEVATCTQTFTPDAVTPSPSLTPATTTVTSTPKVSAQLPDTNLCPQNLTDVTADSINLTVVPPFDPQPSMETTKTADPPVITGPGQVTYYITVKNTGNTDLSDLVVTDPMFGGPADCNGVTFLAVGSPAITCTGTHNFTPEEVAAGITYKNTAKVEATPTHDGEESGTLEPSEPSTDVLLASLSLHKTLKNPDAAPTLGVDDAVDYNVHVENTGAATIDFINIVDTIKSGDPNLTAGTILTVEPGACGANIDPNNISLAEGESVDCTVTYKPVTQHDVDTCKITNYADAAGYWRTPGQDADPAVKTAEPSHEVKATDNIDLTIGQTYGLSLVQSVDPVSASVTANSDVTFTYDIKNMGNTDLTDFTIAPVISGAVDAGWSLNCGTFDLKNDMLAPNDTLTCTVKVHTTEVHSSAPSPTTTTVSSTLTVTAKPPSDDVCSDEVITSNDTKIDVTVTPIFDPDPKMVTTKTATPSVISAPGPVDVKYTITVTNPGNTDLRNIAVTDDDLTKLGVSLDCGGKTFLAAQSDSTDSVVCTGTHTFLDGEMASANTFVNVATVAADSYHGNDISGTIDPQHPTATVSVARIALTKVADVESVSAVGDVIHYTFTITNTGAVDLNNVTINEGDFVSGTSTIDPNPIGDITCNGLPLTTLTLTPGQSAQCTASYAVQQRDLDGGYMLNNATAVGNYDIPGQQTPGQVSADDSANVIADQTYDLTLDESVAPDKVTVGGNLVFTYTITNNGNVDLTRLTFTETSFTGNGIALDIANMTCVTGEAGDPFDLFDPASVIAPGQVVVCTVPAYKTVSADAKNQDKAVISNGQIVGYPTDISVRTPDPVSAEATATGYVYPPHTASTGGTVTTSAIPMALFIGLLGLMAAAALLIRRRGLLR